MLEPFRLIPGKKAFGSELYIPWRDAWGYALNFSLKSWFRETHYWTPFAILAMFDQYRCFLFEKFQNILSFFYSLWIGWDPPFWRSYPKIPCFLLDHSFPSFSMEGNLERILCSNHHISKARQRKDKSAHSSTLLRQRNVLLNLRYTSIVNTNYTSYELCYRKQLITSSAMLWCYVDS